MDLLLYLVRKHEVDILEIPIATITEQYLAYLDVLEQLSVNAFTFCGLESKCMSIWTRSGWPRYAPVQVRPVSFRCCGRDRILLRFNGNANHSQQ